MSATHTTLAQLLPLAKELDESTVSPGVLGFVVFAVMAAGVWMLMKSMNRHMNRIDFEEAPAPDARTGATTGPGPGAPAKKRPKDA